MVGNVRQVFDDGLLFGNFGVENAKWIRFDAPLRIGAELVMHLAQCSAKRFDVLGAAIFVADGIDEELRAGETGGVEKGHEHFDQFGVDGRCVGLAENFGADLVELAEAAFLRAFAAEHGAHVIELHVAGKGLHAVFDVSAARGGGGFGAEGELVTVRSVLESFAHGLLFGFGSVGAAALDEEIKIWRGVEEGEHFLDPSPNFDLLKIWRGVKEMTSVSSPM